MKGYYINENMAQAINLNNNEGYLLSRFSSEQLKPIYDEMILIESDFTKAKRYNNSLAGNIENEFQVSENLSNYLFTIVSPLVDIIESQYGYIKNIDILDRPCPLKMHSVWMNFQKKHEFNPLHNHSGVMSFVLWLKVPYTIEQELSNPSTQNSKMKCPGHFSFVHTSVMGELYQELIPVDNTYEGVISVFPSKLYHQVYPFYTSDEYRVSISGNFCLDTSKV